MRIETERLTLRPLALLDLDTTHAYAGDPDNTEYMVYLPNHTKAETEQFLRRVVTEWEKDAPQFYEFAVVLHERHIGAVSVSLDEDRAEGELGWIFHKAYHGQGYATEAAKAVLDFTLRELPVKRIVAACDCRNAPSCRVMEKIGLSLESADGMRRNKNSIEDTREYKYALTVGE